MKLGRQTAGRYIRTAGGGAGRYRGPAVINPQVGDRVSEYLLDQQVGAGSFGQVWKAHHHIWRDKVVAVKIPTDSQFVRNLQREGTTIHGLQHPNIVRAIGLDPYAEIPYLIMEFVDGQSMRQVIQQHPKGMPIMTAQRIISGILKALDHAHTNGVVHRDIKPENILIAGAGAKPAEKITIDDVKVTDFGLGLAGQITTETIMQSGSMVSEQGRSISGTLAYMAPEQRDEGRTDARSDLYAVGILLFESIVGERPSGSDLPSHVREGLPSWVDPVYSRLYTRWERRFPSATEVLRTIETASVPPVVRPSAASKGSAPAYPAMPDARRSAPPPVVRKGERICPDCHEVVPIDDNYCIHCGSQLAARIRRCACCGAYPENDDRFCIRCGTQLPAAVA